MFREMRSSRIKQWQSFPILRLGNNVFCILTRAFGVAAPFIFRAPIADTERRCRRDFYKIEIIGALKGDLRGGKRFGRLIVNGKMPPECDRRLIGIYRLRGRLEFVRDELSWHLFNYAKCCTGAANT